MKKQFFLDKYAIGYIYKQVGPHDYTDVGQYDFYRTFRQNIVSAVGRARYDHDEGYYVLFEPFDGDPVMITKENLYK